MQDHSENVGEAPINHYWRDVLAQIRTDGKPKYSKLGKVVKSSLILAHVNADIERVFSVNKHLVTTKKASMSAETTNAVKIPKDAVRFFDPGMGRPEHVPITKKLLLAVKGAYTAYEQRLEVMKAEKEKTDQLTKESKAEAERLKEEADKRKEQTQELVKNNAALSQEEDKLCAKENEAKDSLSVGEKLLNEGNDKLAKAIKETDFAAAASVVHAMIEAGQKKCKETSNVLKSTMESRQTLAKQNENFLIH
ncbi:uncharacterized protein LOC111085594 [Limulus polyphemus]|uniref:Uncharacterized protein LOC111085594 n=1 Tax=Limulus polyphemus TaxID=6850 RepID=A0ABM1SAD5_LIMPO|nr:uncharacterized protein LOC111085594 [Limulus polyphemus]